MSRSPAAWEGRYMRSSATGGVARLLPTAPSSPLAKPECAFANLESVRVRRGSPVRLAPGGPALEAYEKRRPLETLSDRREVPTPPQPPQPLRPLGPTPTLFLPPRSPAGLREPKTFRSPIAPRPLRSRHIKRR